MCTIQTPQPHPGWSMHGKCHTPPAPCCRPTRSRSPHIHAAASGHNTTKSLHQSSCPRLVSKHMLFSPMDAVNALGSFSFRLRTRANKYNLYLSLKPRKFCASVFVRPSYKADAAHGRACMSAAGLALQCRERGARASFLEVLTAPQIRDGQHMSELHE